MKLALVEELGEFVASTGYADWKKTVRDEGNMDIELIDIAVFAINIAYYESEHGMPQPSHFIVPKNEWDLVDQIMTMFVTESWISISYLIFKYNPELVKVIIAKQALNSLRQDYGYRRGEYIKDWNGEEDNTHLPAFYGLPYEEIYDKMEDIYTTKILAGRLVNVHD